MIDRLLHYLDEGEIDGENPIDFADADKDFILGKRSVERCVSSGIIHGDDLGKFNPANRTTRAQAATMIQAAAAYLKAAAEQKEENENAAEKIRKMLVYLDNVNQTLIRYFTSIGPMNREDVLNYNPLREETTSQQMLILLTCLSILIFRK